MNNTYIKDYGYINLYREKGLNLVPFKTIEGVNFEWKPYQAKKSTDAEIEAWKDQTAFWAIITGSISNLVVIDIDAEDLFEDMHFGQLAATTYTEKRGNRYHIFLRTKKPIPSDSLKFKGNTDIDILSEGHIVYAGGMPHPKGGEQYMKLDWSRDTIKETNIEAIEALKRFWREHRGLVTKKEKGLSSLPKGISITEPLLNIIKDCTPLEEETLTDEGIVCRCPFPNHKDTDPSFFVNTKKNVFFCQGCAKGGGAIEFISLLYGIGKKAAIKQLKDQGVLTEVEKEEEEVFNHDNFFEVDNTLYMEVRNAEEDRYTFAYIEDGVVKLTEIVGDIKPVEIPRAKNGKVTSLMEVPSENVVGAELLDANALFNEMYNHIARYCDLEPKHLELATFYTLFTWFHRKVHDLGYLRFLADFGKGKSRMLDVIGGLCFYPLRAGGAGSFSGMMRQHENWHGTLLLDESDFDGDTTDQRVKYHNQGINDRGTFLLTQKDNPDKQEVFTPFGPRLFGARETFLDSALESRLLSISTYSTNNEDIDVLLQSEYFKETKILADKIARFVLERWDEIDGDNLTDFPGLGLSRRLRQMLMPMTVIGQIWPEAIGKIRDFGIQRQRDVKLEASQSWAGSLFNIVLGLARGDIQAPAQFHDHKNADGELVAITPGMLKEMTGRSGQHVTKALKSIHFEVVNKSVEVATFDAEGNAKNRWRTLRGYSIPNDKRWVENIESYYYSDEVDLEKIKNDEKTQRLVPEILKSPTYIANIAKFALKTHHDETFSSDKRGDGQKGSTDPKGETEADRIEKLTSEEVLQRQQDIEAKLRMNAEAEVGA